MGSNGGEHIKILGNDAAECSETTVEIKIKTLDSQTFTLRVDKCVPVPELKEQIASVTGVLSEQQRLICRGKVLKDDQLLSAYHVEDGHTLHLVVRQPVAPSPELSDHPATDPMSSTGHSPGNRVGPGMMVGTFNISDQGDGAFPDLNRIVSTVLNSFGVTRFGSGGEGIDLNQPPLERHRAVPGLGGNRHSSRLQSDQAASVAVPAEPLQPPIIPDSLTTLLQYVSHLRREFLANAGGQNSSARDAGNSGSDRQESEAAVRSSESRGLLTPEFLAEVMSSARQLLSEQATECLSELAGQLESHSSVTDPLERSRIQSNAIRSGALFQNLGALLLELGRAIMTLRMGQTPADALVNAGPSVFVSSTGPNPIMVQPLPFQPGASFGSVPVGTVQHGSGLAGGSAAGTGFLPRNIDIRIRTGSLFPRRGEPTTGSQTQGQAAANSVNPGQQDEATALDPNPPRNIQVRAIPIRTAAAAVPSSVGRDSDSSSRGSIGILYPVLARVQHLSGNSTQASDQPLRQNTEQQPTPNSAQNGNSTLASEEVEGFSAQLRGGIEQLLSSIFPPGGEQQHIAAVPSHHHTAETAQESASSASTSAVSDEGILLSNILRQIMPILSPENNTRAGGDSSSTEGGEVTFDETQQQVADYNVDRGGSSRHRRGGPHSQPRSKRQRRE